MVSMFEGGFLNDRMVQISIYAAIVFFAVAHPETFKFVDGLLGVGKDKSNLLLIHTLVFAVLMYFGTKMIFDPVMRGLVDGFRSGPKAKKPVRPASPAARKASPAKRPAGRAPSRKR